MVWFDPEHAASAQSGAAKAERDERSLREQEIARNPHAPAECRDVGPSTGKRTRPRRPLCFMPMDRRYL